MARSAAQPAPRPWTLYQLELPVGTTASNINFGVLFLGAGTAWVDFMKVELDGQPYSNPQFDFDFESPTAKGFYIGCGGSAGCTDYQVGVDDTASYSAARASNCSTSEVEQPRDSLPCGGT